MASCKPPQRLCDRSPMPQAQWPLEQAVAFPKQACKGVFPLSEVSHTPVPVISCPVLCNSLTLTTNTIWMRPGTDHSGQWPELRVVWLVIMQKPWPLILYTDRWAILKGLTQLLRHQKQRGGWLCSHFYGEKRRGKLSGLARKSPRQTSLSPTSLPTQHLHCLVIRKQMTSQNYTL